MRLLHRPLLRLVLAAFTLDVHAAVLSFQALFTLAIDVALIGVDIAAGVARIDHRLKVQGIVLAGGADLELANELVTPVGIGRELVA